ncbi:MAG: S1/P1 Nuclease [Sphingobacteriales bacterium]|nr:MAG: S1/P1 Nuclease [Sphingobacteriales bacterium]
MKKLFFLLVLLAVQIKAHSWGFFGHRKINYYSVFLLPPEMMVLYKSQIDFLTEHSTDPDKRRYAVSNEAPKHYLDIDHYGTYPYNDLPRKWTEAVAKYGQDSLNAHGIVPWWVQTMMNRLTEAFKEKNQAKILKYSAEIGHYIADAHVPLHASSNHDGQLSDQKGIHAFWESRLPELLADKDWDFFIGKADYIQRPGEFIWARFLESAKASDTVLHFEKTLSQRFPGDKKYGFENRNGVVIRQYSSEYSNEYNSMLNGMVERRMRQAIYCVSSFWYTAWVNAGQPDLSKLSGKEFSAEELKEFEELNNQWKSGKIQGREHE